MSNVLYTNKYIKHKETGHYHSCHAKDCYEPTHHRGYYVFHGHDHAFRVHAQLFDDYLPKYFFSELAPLLNAPIAKNRIKKEIN